MAMYKYLQNICNGLREFKSILSGNVGIMAISWFLFGLSGALVQPFFTLYAKALGASDLAISYIRSAGMVALAISVIFGGFLTDFIGRVKTIVLGTSLIVITQYAYAFARDWVMLSIIWIIDEMAHFYQPALTAIVMDSLPRDETLRGFLALNAFPSIPWLFMPIVGGYLFDKYGLPGIRFGFIISGSISVVVLVLRVKGLKETYKASNRSQSISSVFTEVFRYRNVLGKAMVVFIFTSFVAPLVSAVPSTYSAIYVVEVLGETKSLWGYLSSISTAVSIVLSFLFAMARVGRSIKLVLLSGASVSLSTLFLALAYYVSGSTRFLILLSSTLFGTIGGVIIWPLISTILTHILPVEIRGRMTGFQRMLENIGAALTALIAGYLYTSLGPVSSFLLSFAMGVPMILYLIYLYKMALSQTDIIYSDI